MIEQERHNLESSVTPDNDRPLSIGGYVKKYTGLQMFQRYCIPNSTTTKNPLFLEMKALGKQPFYSLEDTPDVSLEDRLKKRLLGCYLFGSWHLLFLLYSGYFVVEAPQELVKALNIFCVVGNAYLVANQVEIRSRIKRVMQQRGYE